jgi:NAD(P)-dependent dehydrogenase (short-subunit alcohol dehydrogenase family)
MGKNLKKQAVVIGATGNLGKAICKALINNGFRIDKKWIGRDRPDVLDVNAFNDLPKVIDTAIYVAGINKVAPFNKIKKEDFENVINVNLMGAINFYKNAFKSLKNSKNSSCIVISSIMVTHPYPNRAPYAISKAALESLVKCLAVEWGRYNISTHAIRLGHLNSLMKTTKTNPLLLKKVKKLTPIKKLISTVEVAKYVAFLTNGGCKSLSGGTTVMDSGYTINRWPL